MVVRSGKPKPDIVFQQFSELLSFPEVVFFGTIPG